MAPTITEIMQAVETRLKTIPGLRVEPYVADQVNPPQAVVGVPEVPDYRKAMGRGSFELDVHVHVLVSKALDRVGQKRLAEYANPTGPTSVVAAIDGDKTLGGTVGSCHVTGFRPIGMEEVGAIGYYGGTFTLKIYAPGK